MFVTSGVGSCEFFKLLVEVNRIMCNTCTRSV